MSDFSQTQWIWELCANIESMMLGRKWTHLYIGSQPPGILKCTSIPGYQMGRKNLCETWLNTAPFRYIRFFRICKSSPSGLSVLQSVVDVPTVEKQTWRKGWLITVRNSSCGKVMFLQVSVCPRGCLSHCMMVYTPPWEDTPRADPQDRPFPPNGYCSGIQLERILVWG